MLICRQELTADLRLLSFEKPAFKVGLWLTSGDLAGFREGTCQSLIRVAHYAQTVCINRVVYAKPLLSFSWEPGILACARTRMPTWAATNKLWTLSRYRASLTDNISHVLSHSMLEELSACCVLSSGFLEAYFSFPPDFTPCAFSLYWFFSFFFFPLIFFAMDYVHRSEDSMLLE